ncbi:MAG: hypothetical protein ABSG71_22170 [Thermodesulfobacteriota bacterium]
MADPTWNQDYWWTLAHGRVSYADTIGSLTKSNLLFHMSRTSTKASSASYLILLFWAFKFLTFRKRLLFREMCIMKKARKANTAHSAW